MNPPCVLHEDDHLLVVDKPAGMNTHAPSPYAGEGIYDWLRHRESRWSDLAILHRLDKETSGVLVFGKTAAACRSLTPQFSSRAVRKRYVFHTDRQPPRDAWEQRSWIGRVGDRYRAFAAEAPDCLEAVTEFRVLGVGQDGYRVEAEPRTGRTHQIRVHAAQSGVPIVGDALYGGSPAARLFLHALEISFIHPGDGRRISFLAPLHFDRLASQGLRDALCALEETDTFRCIHGATDGWPGWYVERFGDYLLSQSAGGLDPAERALLSQWLAGGKVTGVYHRLLTRSAGKGSPEVLSPQHIEGEQAPPEFVIRENGARYSIRFGEGYSVGLFLDQRDNRRRFLVNHVAADFPLFQGSASGKEVLNAFAYTCGFSVCAALGGARTTSLDLSRGYLDWGRRNFALNHLDPAVHDFIYGDSFDWMRRLARKGRRFDAVILDPPTFSQSKEHGVFRAEKDYGRLVATAAPLLGAGAVLLACCNTVRLPVEAFLSSVREGLRHAGRRVALEHYVPQPPDFPISRGEPAYLKTVWLRVD